MGILKSFPWDSTPTDLRLINDFDESSRMAQIFTTGIRNGGTNLQVQEKEGFNVQILAGMANIEGYFFWIIEDDDGDSTATVTLDNSHSKYDRIDRVILRMNRNIEVRDITPMVLRGTASSSPKAPELTRTDYIYDICLAEITVPAGSSEITKSNITDTRYDNDLCGIINCLLQLDTTSWQKIFDDFMDGLYATFDEFKQAVYDELKGVFDTKIGEIEAWYAEIRSDITRLQSFCFDNWAGLPGTTYTTDTSSNPIREEIILTSSGLKVADRTTTFNSDGSITEAVIVYERNGSDIMKQATKVTTFNGNTITEVVT